MFAGELNGTVTSAKATTEKKTNKAGGGITVQSGEDPLFSATTSKSRGKGENKKKATTPSNKPLFDEDDAKYVFL